MAVKQLIERIELDSSAASITFSSIPQDYDDLIVLLSVRAGATGGFMSINGSTADRSNIVLFGNGSATGDFSGTDTFTTYFSSTAQTANTFGNSKIYISNYTSSSAKSFSVDGVNENNATSANMLINAGLWNNSAAITSLAFTTSSGNIEAGSTISLYGITRGGDGTVTTA